MSAEAKPWVLIHNSDPDSMYFSEVRMVAKKAHWSCSSFREESLAIEELRLGFNAFVSILGTDCTQDDFAGKSLIEEADKLETPSAVLYPPSLDYTERWGVPSAPNMAIPLSDHPRVNIQLRDWLVSLDSKPAD